jgi:hypothetical protein
MSYHDKFELVRTSLISHCKDCIIRNWERMFDMWLQMEADMEFGYGYQNKFKEQFNQYMNSDIESLLWLSGKNIVFAINAFMLYKNNAELEDVLDFTEKFISEQLDDFDNWCDEIGSTMYEESSDYERDVADRKEDNPS